MKNFFIQSLRASILKTQRECGSLLPHNPLKGAASCAQPERQQAAALHRFSEKRGMTALITRRWS
jgi:hypothetical protein